MDEIKTYLVETDKDKLAIDTVFEGYSKRAHVYGEEQDYRSFIEADVRISVLQDGALVLSDQDGESFMYVYPEQLAHLRKALVIAECQYNIKQ